MSTITVAVDDTVLEQARKIAAEKHTTVDALLRDCLNRLTEQQELSGDELHAQVRRDILAMLGTFDVKVGATPTRARTYAKR